MWVVFLEISLALALAAFIVWWTWPGKAGVTTRISEARAALTT